MTERAKRIRHAESHIAALTVIDEAARRAEAGPIERTEDIWDALRLLASVKPSPAYKQFWATIARPLRNNEAADFGRRQTLNNAAGYIHYLHGVEWG